MKVNNNWTRVVYILGLIALCICAIDPMEGSVGILIGSILVALSSFLRKTVIGKFSCTVLLLLL